MGFPHPECSNRKRFKFRSFFIGPFAVSCPRYRGLQLGMVGIMTALRLIMVLRYIDLDKTALSLEAHEVDVCNAHDFDIVERQAAFYMDSPGPILKISFV